MSEPLNSPTSCRSLNGILVLCVAGETTGHVLQQALAAAGTAPTRTVVDLSRVTFMDSPGINILIAAHTALAHAGGWLRLAAATASVRGTLQIVGLDHVIDCRATLHRGLST